MTNKTEEEAGPVTVQIGVCSVCHALFMLSGDRLTSPCHGADPLAVLATLTIFPGGGIDGDWGMGAPIGELDIREEPAPAAAPLEEPSAEEAEEAAEGPVETALEVLRSTAALYVAGDLNNAAELREAFVAAGAEPERAANAVGRLDAVREELRRLAVPEDHALAVPDAPEAEIPAENT